jgi:transposase InsO family protein
MKFQAMERLQGEYPVELMAHVFSVSKSGFYDWRKRSAERALKQKNEQQLVEKIQAIHLGSKRNYGSPRVADRLDGLGHRLSPRTVARVMKKHGIRSRLKRKFKVTTDSDHRLPVAPNHLMQDFRAYCPGQIWMSDITYVRTQEGWLYVCAIIDLCTKKVVGWSAGSRMPKDLVIAAYLRARRNEHAEDWLIFHSDRGCQYASREFAAMLKRHGVIQSMSRRGNCWDSAPIESLWARLKTECVYWERFKTRQDALETISEWFREYNEERSHSAIGYRSPIEAEREFVMASRSGNE